MSWILPLNFFNFYIQNAKNFCELSQKFAKKRVIKCQNCVKGTNS